MKKGEQLTIEIADIKFPNKPYGFFEQRKVYPKSNCIPGQTVTGRIKKLKKDKIELGNIEVIKKAENQIEWVGRMNNIRSRAVEIVNAELIYS